MLEPLFTPDPSVEAKVSLRPRKGVIIGVGQVGMACAYSMIIQNCLDALVLQDIQTERIDRDTNRAHSQATLAAETKEALRTSVSRFRQLRASPEVGDRVLSRA